MRNNGEKKYLNGFTNMKQNKTKKKGMHIGCRWASSTTCNPNRCSFPVRGKHVGKKTAAKLKGK